MATPNQDIVTAHWNFRANSYRFNINKDFFGSSTAIRWRDLLSEAIGDVCEKKVLDVGCGPAVLTRILLDLGHEVTAVDVSEKMLEIAKEAVGADTSRVTFHQANAADLPFEDNSFDLIMNRFVVWTLPDPVQAMAEWHRVLKPGGRLGIIDGNWYYFYYRSGLKKLWSNTVNGIYKMRSGFDPGQKLATKYARDLPSTHLLRPDWDQGVLSGLGFKDIKVYQGLEKRIYGTWSPARLKDPWNHQFLVMATK